MLKYCLGGGGGVRQMKLSSHDGWGYRVTSVRPEELRREA